MPVRSPAGWVERLSSARAGHSGDRLVVARMEREVDESQPGAAPDDQTVRPPAVPASQGVEVPDVGPDDGGDRRTYQGRRRQRVGAIGWLRGLGTIPLLLAGAVVVGLLAGLAWWAGGGSAGTPVSAPAPATSGLPGAAPTGETTSSPSQSPPASAHPSGSSLAPSPGPSGSVPVSPGTPASSAPPAPPPNLVRYEAENANTGTGTVATNHRNYSGAGFVDYTNASGGYVEWQVTVPVAGTVTLMIGYANGSGVDRPMQVTVNGTVVPPGTGAGGLSFPATKDWDTWARLSITVTLPAGTSAVRATATSQNGGPNVDYLDVQT